MFFVNGSLFATWVSRIPRVKADLGLSESALGLALFVMAIGTFAALPATVWLIARFGSRSVTAGAALACCAVLAAVGFAPTFGLLAAALGLLGATMGAMDVAMNSQASLLEKAHERSIMASFHGLWSLGGLVGAAAGGVFAAQQLTPFDHFLAVGVLLSLLAVVAARWLLPDTGAAPSAVLAWPSRAVLGVGLVAACGAIVEGGIADWSGVYLRETLATGAGFAASGFAAFSLAMTIGRLTGDRMIDRFGPVPLLRAGAALAGVAIGGALLVGNPYVAVVGFAAAGIGMSVVFPIAFSVAGRLHGTLPSTAIAAVATMAYGAGMAGPPFIGFAAGSTSLTLALGLLVFMCVLIGLLAGNLGARAQQGVVPNDAPVTARAANE